MTRLSHLLLAPFLGLLAVAPAAVSAQAVVPADHPGFALAEAVAAQDCVLHQDDVNGLLEELGLDNAQFPQMAVPLMRDGYLMPSGNGTMTLVNWGLCTGADPDASGAQPDSETTDTETE